MRQPRLKGSAHPCFYHCISRVTNGQRIFEGSGSGCPEAEYWVRLLHRLAAFCGIPVLTYAVMANHFHLLCEVPQPRLLSDPELLERVEALYGQARRHALQRVLAGQTPGGELAAQTLREALQARMFDLSRFLQELKSRFAQWYNRRHGRFGPLWAERFKSLLVQDGTALQAVALYIDLNPVRAKQCADPKDYGYSGYGEAVGAGRVQARAGLARALGYEPDQTSWAEVGAEYRCLLFRAGVVAAKPEQAVIEPEVARRVVEQEKGALPAGVSLGCRLRFLTNGLVLGSRRFVEEQLSRWRGPGQPPGPGAEPAGAAQGGGAEWFVCWRGRAVPARGAPG
ncbi:MAG: transposase [Verrucomicrobia bacterium]|nr:transposase [Verrucomicrobiota bacterium]